MASETTSESETGSCFRTLRRLRSPSSIVALIFCHASSFLRQPTYLSCLPCVCVFVYLLAPPHLINSIRCLLLLFMRYSLGSLLVSPTPLNNTLDSPKRAPTPPFTTPASPSCLFISIACNSHRAALYQLQTIVIRFSIPPLARKTAGSVNILNLVTGECAVEADFDPRKPSFNTLTAIDRRISAHFFNEMADEDERRCVETTVVYLRCDNWISHANKRQTRASSPCRRTVCKLFKSNRHSLFYLSLK